MAAEIPRLKEALSAHNLELKSLNFDLGQRDQGQRDFQNNSSFSGFSDSSQFSQESSNPFEGLVKNSVVDSYGSITAAEQLKRSLSMQHLGQIQTFA